MKNDLKYALRGATTAQKLDEVLQIVSNRDVRIAELEVALEKISDEFYPCGLCGGTGNDLDDPKTACRICGGYGFNPGGDIRDARAQAINVLDGVS